MSQDLPDDGPWIHLIEHSSDVITVIDDDATIMFESPAVEQVLGYEPAKLIGQNAFEYIHPNDLQEVWAEFSSVIENPGDVTKRVEFRFRHADGSWVWLETVGSNPIGSELDGYVLNSRDITERKTRERELRERNKKLTALHETTRLFVTRTDPLEIILEDLVERIPRWFQYPEHTEARITCGEIRATSSAFRPSNVEIRATSSLGDDREVTFEVAGNPRWSGDDSKQFLPDEERLVETITQFLGETVTRRSQQRSLQLFERAIEDVGHAVVITDDAGKIVFVNREFESQTGYDREFAVGKTHRILKSGHHDQAFYEQMWETILAGETWEAALINRRQDGSLYYIEQTISPITTEGEITHFIAIGAEITQRRIREQQLEVLNRLLRHNLRNSLTVIRGHADLIRDQSSSDAIVRSTQTIQREGDRLVDLSEKNTRVSRLFDTPIDPQATVELTAILRSFEETVPTQYPDARFSFEYPEEVWIAGDDGINIALDELIQNAVVHADTDRPEVSVSLDAPSPQSLVDLSIVDNGPGIPSDHVDMLEAGVETPLVHGSGLGLWVVSWIVSRIGGEIEFGTVPSGGAEVTLRLPQAAAN